MKTGRLIWGIALIMIGVVWAVNALGIADIRVFFDGWWTLFIIVPCVASLFTRRQKFASTIGLIIGVALFLNAQGILDLTALWQLSLPIALIMAGLKLINVFGFRRKAKSGPEDTRTVAGETVTETAAFATRKIDYDGQVFAGADLDAVFGSIRLDLNHARIENDCIVSISAIFATVEVLVPDDVKVAIESSTLFGGVSDRRAGEAGQDAGADRGVTLHVEANCLIGGVYIT
ncbi:MAG: LiaF-related protein [Bacillota bacterium]|nr:LiaF-related protein [Bacillota bacterium]